MIVSGRRVVIELTEQEAREFRQDLRAIKVSGTSGRHLYSRTLELLLTALEREVSE